MQMTSHGKNHPMLHSKSKRLILLLLLLYGSYGCYSQSLTLSLKNAPLEKAFREIEAKVQQRFVYTSEMINRSSPVTIKVRNTPLPNVLDLLFEDQPLEYSLGESFIKVRFRTVPILPEQKGIDVNGTVFNEKGEPLSGASVTVKRKDIATATDNKGRFYLKGLSKDDVLVISYIGYKPEEVDLNERTSIVVYLQTLITPLDETVVIAYGTTTRRLNTGSVGRVTSKEIERQPVSNPLAALEGRVPGLFITQGNGLPGSNFEVLIRGRNSLQNGTSPLYIVDGVPFLSNDDRLTQRSSLNANNPFNTIPPGDIESIEVLKDADATAIYGSRGANGVILITTKKSKSGQTGVNVQVYSGIGRPTRSLSFMNTEQYLQMRREAFKNDGVTPDASNAPDLLLWDTTRYVNWKDALMGEKAQITNANIRFSGGNALTRFSLSSGYYKETTVFPGNFSDQRGSVNLTMSHQSTDKKFEATLTAGYAFDKSILPLQNLGQYINLPPNAMDIYDDNGQLNWNEGAEYFGNPIALLQQTYQGITNRLTSNIILQYHLTPSFVLKTSIGYNDVRFDERSVTPISSQNPAYNPTGEANFGSNAIQSWIIEPQAAYKHTLGKKGILEILAGFTIQRSHNYSTLMRGTNYSNDALLKSTVGAGNIVSSNAENLYRYAGMFGRVNYNLLNRYLINLTGRRDGSSRFGPGNQFANFGAVGMGWIFSKEHWAEQHLSFISFGKIRGSYGVTGSDQINNYQYLDTWRATQYPYGDEIGFQPSRLFNPNYSWEQIQKLEAALELGFIQDRILLTVSRFRNVSDNQIISYSLPTQTGFSTVLRNFPGRILNRGWELEATAVPVHNKHISWTASFNLTLPHNELLAFPGLASSSYATQYMIGKPVNMQMGYHYLGVDPQTGIYQFEDVNKNGQMDWDNSDYVYLGTTDPKFYGGLQNTLQYKGWELSFFLEFRKQRGLNPIASSGTLNGDLLNQPKDVLQRWQKPGDIAPYQRYTQDYNSPLYEAAYFLSVSDAIFTDASFMRLKNASLSYTLPEGLLKKAAIRQCRLFIQGQNLLTFTRYVGADPENQSIVGLPPLRIITGGIQITF